MTVNLHGSVQGEGAPVVLLHGLFGNGNNLGALARALRDRYRVYSVDLPNHGRSGWLHRSDIATLAHQLLPWLDGEGLECSAFVGHSLGGKIAMQLALEYPWRVSALVVADIAPVAYPPHHDQVFAALDAVDGGECSTRAEAAEVMAEHLDEEAVIQFLLMSLQRGEDGICRWRFNLEGIREGYSAVRDGLHARSAFPGPALFVKGGDSDYIREEHRAAILGLFPAASLKVIPGTGHWLHAQEPRLFYGIVGRFLDSSLEMGRAGAHR